MKIGIIGAESKHVEFFGIPINKEKSFGNARVACIWGGDTTEERLASCSLEAGIETIARTPSDVIDSSDAVIITLRNGALHAEYAIECIKKHKPVFIDKPFTVEIEDSLSILKAVADYGTPFTGGSTLCFLPEIPKLQELYSQSPYTEISYRADPFSPFGGWYFYGSHLTDLCSSICGQNAIYVEAEMTKDDVSVNVYYLADKLNQKSNSFVANKKVRIYSAPDLMYPTVKMEDTYILNDKTCYIYGLKAFFETISTGNSPDGERLLFSVRLMDAIMRSAASQTAAAIRT
jgi:predicted dehydrogenase